MGAVRYSCWTQSASAATRSPGSPRNYTRFLDNSFPLTITPRVSMLGPSPYGTLRLHDILRETEDLKLMGDSSASLSWLELTAAKKG